MLEDERIGLAPGTWVGIFHARRQQLEKWRGVSTECVNRMQEVEQILRRLSVLWADMLWESQTAGMPRNKPIDLDASINRFHQMEVSPIVDLVVAASKLQYM